MQYERILKQRNTLLRAIAEGVASPNDLDLWDDQLATVAVQMMRERSELLSAIEPLLISHSASLKEDHTDVRLEYLPSGSVDHSTMKSKLLLARTRDIAVQTTSAGPHRDDWRITTSGRSIASYLSRGQQRTFFLALLFASADLFDQYRHEKPVILLDDVLSELDEDHQKALLHFFSPYQVFITTTHPLDLPEHFQAMEMGE
jgi:DNA replication and repair protein RecF